MSNSLGLNARYSMEGPPPTLIQILEGYLKEHGHITRDREEIEMALGDLDEIAAYAEACGASISLADAERISQAGLIWVRDVNEESGEWGRMRDEAAALLAD